MFQTEPSLQHTVAKLPSGKLDWSFPSVPPFHVHCASGNKDHTIAFCEILYIQPDVSAESHRACLIKLLDHLGKIPMYLAHFL